MDVATGELECIGTQRAVHIVGVRVVHFGSALGCFANIVLATCGLQVKHDVCLRKGFLR